MRYLRSSVHTSGMKRISGSPSGDDIERVANTLRQAPVTRASQVSTSIAQLCSAAAASSRTASSGVGGSSCSPLASGGDAARAGFAPIHFHRTA